MEKEKTITIDSDLAEKFDLALMLNKEEFNDVITRFVMQYVSESFSKVSRTYSVQPVVETNYNRGVDNNFAKANRKIPLWAQKPTQNNHKIIKAFFEIEEEKGFVTIEELTKRCSDPTEFPNTFVSDFRGNFAQMKTDASNSHGKVFVVNGDKVEMWDEIEDVLMENKDLFINSSEEGYKVGKITNEMVTLAYDYAKKVYLGELSRNEGKFEIARVAGMNAGSAQDFITDFLAMMSGNEYHRTMSNFATTYFIENIRKDFGEKAYQSALDATEKHIKYYNSLGYGKLKAKEEIVKKFREMD
ncbi:MAG: hypothetical protein AB9888_08155 [Bacteroidales bacterium]